MENKKPNIYFAAGLFHLGDRYRNAILVQCLVNLGYTVIVPQREARKFILPQQLVEMAEDCFASAMDSNNILVLLADGGEPDCGASVEYGAAMAINRRAVYVRTDIRTAIDVEAGINAMFRLRGTQQVIHPCNAVEVNEFTDYCKDLAWLIHEAIGRAMAV